MQNQIISQQFGSLLNIHVKFQDHRESQIFKQVLLLRQKTFYNATYIDAKEIICELKLRGLNFEFKKENIFYYDYSTNTIISCYDSLQDKYEVEYIPSQAFLKNNQEIQVTLIIGSQNISNNLYGFEEHQNQSQNQFDLLFSPLYTKSEQCHGNDSKLLLKREPSKAESTPIEIAQIEAKTKNNIEQNFSLDIFFEPSSTESTQKQNLEEKRVSQFRFMPRGKGRERTIQEASKVLREWKRLKSEKQIPLKVGAKMIGVPLKSLEEYNQDFRSGIFYNFDFKKNYNKKIGFLRQYCRLQNEKVQRVPKAFYKSVDEKVLEALENLEENEINEE